MKTFTITLIHLLAWVVFLNIFGCHCSKILSAIEIQEEQPPPIVSEQDEVEEPNPFSFRIPPSGSRYTLPLYYDNEEKEKYNSNGVETKELPEFNPLEPEQAQESRVDTGRFLVLPPTSRLIPSPSPSNNELDHGDKNPATNQTTPDSQDDDYQLVVDPAFIRPRYL